MFTRRVKFKPLILSVAFLFFESCATDPGSTVATTGGAVTFTFSGGDADIVVNQVTSGSRGDKVNIAALLYGAGADGARGLATEIEAGVTVTFPSLLTVTLPSHCGSAATLTGTYTHPNSLYQLYFYDTNCTLQPTDSVSASGPIIASNGSDTRTIIGSGSGSSSGSGSGGSGGTTLTEQTAFVTNSTYTGNLGGLSGADALCAASAAAGSATSSLPGTWVAILSDASTSAASRINLGSGPLKNTNGGTILAAATSLWGGSLSSPIRYNEDGTILVSGIAHTGSTSTGGISANANCSSWTSNSALSSPGVGDITRTTGQWIIYTLLNDCSEANHLYCINH